MDANKLKVLQNIDYKIKAACGNCISSTFPSPTDWGTCGAYKYTHLKHGDERDLSINRHGVCENWTPIRPGFLNKFEEFFDGEV